MISVATPKSPKKHQRTRESQFLSARRSLQKVNKSAKMHVDPTEGGGVHVDETG
jgi:hypothetical protein